MRFEKKIPNLKILRECYRYDAREGHLYWRKRPRKHFKSTRVFRNWNNKFAGTRAFTYLNMGYLSGRLFSVVYKEHRVIWKFVTGREPPPMLDHKNRNRSSNKKKNLRPASYGQNFINRSESWGTTGFIGVKRARNGAWEARIHKDKKYIHLGTFRSKAKAVAIRRQATSELYGAFAP